MGMAAGRLFEWIRVPNFYQCANEFPQAVATDRCAWTRHNCDGTKADFSSACAFASHGH
jgi:hypothetical protein